MGKEDADTLACKVLSDCAGGLATVLAEWMGEAAGLARARRTSCLFLPKCVPDVYFVGGRDKRGGPILTFPARSNHDRIRQEDLRRLISYLACIPR